MQVDVSPPTAWKAIDIDTPIRQKRDHCRIYSSGEEYGYPSPVVEAWMNNEYTR